MSVELALLGLVLVIVTFLVLIFAFLGQWALCLNRQVTLKRILRLKNYRPTLRLIKRQLKTATTHGFIWMFFVWVAMTGSTLFLISFAILRKTI